MCRKSESSAMAPLALLVTLLLLPAPGISDDVESKNSDMAAAIEEQDKKVQAQSDAMVNAIEKNSNLVDDRNLEEKFEKASSQVDAVTKSADEKMDSKDKETEELGNEAEDAIEKHAKMVDDLADRADSRQETQSKRVGKLGETLLKTKQIRAKPRTSISYHVALPVESSPGETMMKSMTEASWPGLADIQYHHQLRGSQVEAHRKEGGFWQNSDQSGSDVDDQKPWNLKLVGNNHGKEIDRVIGRVKSATHKPPMYAKVKTGWDNSLRKLHSKLWSPGKTNSAVHPPAHERTSLSRDHSEGKSTGLLVLQSAGQGILRDNELKNQMEEDVMLRKWASQKHTQDPGLSEVLTNRDSEDDIERGWVQINGIGSPEMRKPLLGKDLNTMGDQMVSSMSPAQVEFLQNELPGNHA